MGLKKESTKEAKPSIKTKSPLSADERQKLLDSQLKSMGVLDSIIEGDKFDTKHQDFIPIGVGEIEEGLGEIPGFATGNLVELIGESGSGKTYVALKVASKAQEKGLKVGFFNIENSFYEPRANEIGVITRDKNLFQMIPNLGSGEIMCDIILRMVESGLYGLIVVDSITALIPQALLEQDFEGPRKIGAHATLIGALASKLTYACSKSNTTVILINQHRFGAGAMPNTFIKKATGGEALIFYDHYRLSFRRINAVDGIVYNSKKEIIGGRSEITINKNRYGPSPTKLKFPIYFTEEEFDPITEFVMRAKQKNVELIKETGRKDKKLRYVTEDGEVIESGNTKEFIALLKSVDAPSIKSRNDNSTTAFEYICAKIKFDQKMIEKLNERLLQEDEVELPNEIIDYESQDSDELETE